jgi:hypothetical protein
VATSCAAHFKLNSFDIRLLAKAPLRLAMLSEVFHTEIHMDFLCQTAMCDIPGMLGQ